jgi:polysaccharide pyruvyl transferase WcaK-like protein
MTAFGDFPSTVRAARRCALVVGAGSSWVPSIAGPARIAAVSAAARRPLALFGIGGGPIASAGSRAVARWAARRADLLLLADEASAGHLASAGAPTPIRVSADPAWLGLPPVVASPGRGESVAVVLNGRVPATVEQALGGALVTVAGTGRRVRLVPWSGAGTPDAEMATRLVGVLERAVPGRAAIEPPPATLADAAFVCADAHAVVTLRYRAVHAAAVAGVPVVAVSCNQRAGVLAARLGQPAVAPADLPTVLPIELERIGPAGVPDRRAVEGETGRARAGLRLLRLFLEPDAVPASDVDRLPMVPAPWL